MTFLSINLLPVACLPKGSLIFKNSKLQVANIKNLNGSPGIYLWTNNISGKQYIGSSKNLYSRLEDYFQKSQLINQVNNSNSNICKALLKYGNSSFTLSIYLVKPSTNFIALEQSYLDRFELAYNIRRVAIGSAQISSRIKKVEVFVYDATKKTLLTTFDSVSKFQLFSGLNGSQIKELMVSEDKLWREKYFLSQLLILSADNTMSTPGSFVPVDPIGKKLTFPVYVYKKGQKETLFFESQAKCAKSLGLSGHGIGKAILVNYIYKGYRISRSPLSKPFE